MKQCLKLVISGKVQGVGFREYVQQQARSLSIEGTVQNEEAGAVVILACGSSEDLDLLVDHIYKGCKGAMVENVTAQPLMSEKDFRGVFRIIG